MVILQGADSWQYEEAARDMRLKPSRNHNRVLWSEAEVWALIEYVKKFGPPQKSKDLWAGFIQSSGSSRTSVCPPPATRTVQ